MLAETIPVVSQHVTSNRSKWQVLTARVCEESESRDLERTAVFGRVVVLVPNMEDDLRTDKLVPCLL